MFRLSQWERPPHVSGQSWNWTIPHLPVNHHLLMTSSPSDYPHPHLCVCVCVCVCVCEGGGQKLKELLKVVVLFDYIHKICVQLFFRVLFFVFLFSCCQQHYYFLTLILQTCDHSFIRGWVCIIFIYVVVYEACSVWVYY